MRTQGKRRQVVGTVVSNRMEKTAVVSVERTVKHRFYQKYVRRRSRYAVHDEMNACRIGDRVLITESKPISRTKRWRVSRIVEKAL